MNILDSLNEIMGINNPIGCTVEFVQTPEPGALQTHIWTKVTGVEIATKQTGRIATPVKKVGPPVILNIASDRDAFGNFRQIWVYPRSGNIPSDGYPARISFAGSHEIKYGILRFI